MSTAATIAKTKAHVPTLFQVGQKAIAKHTEIDTLASKMQSVAGQLESLKSGESDEALLKELTALHEEMVVALCDQVGNIGELVKGHVTMIKLLKEQAAVWGS